ncbi:MAG: DHH family phosphoesterase, partial [Anaerolineae bacterium]|nr:DHH family phosphoesterase [Anaerolineae bacterium]
QKGQSLREACEYIARSKRPVAVLDDVGKPLGLLTSASVFRIIADALSAADGQQIIARLVLPGEKALEPMTNALKGSDSVKDVVGGLLRSEPDAYPVVDEAGIYTGICRVTALLVPPRQQLILVDHNEARQAVSGVEEAEVLEVLDHHRLGSIETALPIRFQIEPVGSCSTLVTERALEHKLTLPAPIAGMLLCGILSDTLTFRSPTTTPRDKAAAFKLAAMAGLAGDVESAIEELGRSLLAAGAGLGSRPVEEIINTDIKYYEANGMSMGVAQVEITDVSELNERLSDILEGLNELVTTQKLTLALLLVTDVLQGSSRIVAAGEERLIAVLPYARRTDGTLDAPGVVSRKKQLLPALLAAAAQVG